MDQFTLYHNNRTIKTLSEYMEANNIVGISVDDLFEWKYNDTKSNRELFFEQMSPDEKADYCKQLGKEEGYVLKSDDLKSDMTLPCPCIFKIEAKYVTREIAISQTNFQENTDDIYAFENSHIQNILNNEGYRIDENTKKTAPNCSVWGWFKSLYYTGNTFWGQRFFSKNNKFLNISDFIIDVTTNVSAQGGTFSITLPIIRSSSTLKEMKERVKMGKFDVDIMYADRFAEQAELFLYNRYNTKDSKKNFFHKVGLSQAEDNYFNWLVQSNDLIFISFEDLEMEKENGSKVFDLIGLVDNVVVSLDASGGGNVVVSGRDLMKLISDDNSLFFNISTAWGESRIFSNTQSSGKQGDIRDTDVVGGENTSPENRLRRVTNQIDVFASPFNRTISFVIKGVISQLANIEVVPDFVFTAWGDARTKYNDWLSYQETEIVEIINEDEYGDNETYNNEFSTGIEYNSNRGKDKKISSEGMDFIDAGTTPGSLSIPNPYKNDGLTF